MKEATLQKDNTANHIINSWRRVMGNDSIITDRNIIATYENTTFETKQRIMAILLPENVQEVQQCVRIANDCKVPLYPISKGKNWGYGSNVPASNDCVILSLEKMNSISEFNEEMAYMTVEPGVTFQQVHEFLKQRDSKLIAPSIGSSPEASLIGNALERGIGKGVYGDRFQYSCNMEVVLPSGEIINTGFGNIKNANNKNTYKWGLGPSIDGIFTQSNFGIITRMTFWLDTKPAYFQAIFFMVKDNDELPDAIDALRQLRLEGTLTTTSILSNSHRLLSMQRQFPWKDINDANTLLPDEYVRQVEQRALNGCKWVGDDAILAPNKAIGKARAKRVKQLLKGKMHKVVIIDDNKAKILGIFAKPLKIIFGVDVNAALSFFRDSVYLGYPKLSQLAICYWRKKTPVPAKIDPDKDKCGMIWGSISVSFNGQEIRKVVDISTGIFKKYNFEPSLGFNMMSDRAIAFTTAIIYDREVEGHDKKAMDCYKEIMERLMESGYPPYRLGIQSMDKMLSTSPEYVNFIKKLKAAIDPNNIISPNHYGI